MDKIRLVFDGVWKKFRKGQRARSFRDALPALARLLLQPGSPNELRPAEFFSLRDVSFAAHAGQCLGIIGPNGAGKSTLLKCASRILRPNRGNVRVHGRVSALIEVGAGFHPELTGRENVFLNGIILGMSRREIADRFDRIVDFAGLEEFIDTPVKRYSSGMYARLGFSVAAFMEPAVLLVDEVLSVGDMSFARKCEQKIDEIRRAGAAILFVSHNLSAVRRICDRVLVVNAGRIDTDADPARAIHRFHELVQSGQNEGDCHPAIAGLRLCARDGRNTEVFSVGTGEPLTLDAELTANRAIRDAELGFFVRDDRDHEVYECVMGSIGTATVDLAPGETMSTRFQFIANLLPGTYRIGSIVRGRPAGEIDSGRRMLDRNPHRLHLTVTGPATARGSANLFASCADTYTGPGGSQVSRSVCCRQGTNASALTLAERA